MSIIQKIENKRPNIKKNTIDSYITYINKLYRLYSDSSDTPTEYDWLKNTDKITDILKKYKHTTRKKLL